MLVFLIFMLSFYFILIFLFVSDPKILFDWVPIIYLYSDIVMIVKGNKYVKKKPKPTTLPFLYHSILVHKMLFDYHSYLQLT